MNEDKLSKITKEKYPNAQAVKNDLPNILVKLGWSKERANYISDKVEVDPARGAGHAWAAEMKGVSARLRTHIGKDGMDYKGYNIAVHEFGHNVEQTLSLYDIDYYMLKGVPNTAFTEALAFVFQMRDLDLLGIKSDNPDKHALFVLDNFWSVYEIMGASLVDQKTWKWLYENPNATKDELNIAVNNIAKEVWNKFYYPVLGSENSNILGIYSHMISYPLYLSAYPIGYLIEFQIENYIKGKNLGTEFERMAKIGRVTPNKWMREATGHNISAEPLIKATEEVLEQFGK
jgi:oligoendopeptidase F